MYEHLRKLSDFDLVLQLSSMSSTSAAERGSIDNANYLHAIRSEIGCRGLSKSTIEQLKRDQMDWRKQQGLRSAD